MPVTGSTTERPGGERRHPNDESRTRHSRMSGPDHMSGYDRLNLSNEQGEVIKLSLPLQPALGRWRKRAAR